MRTDAASTAGATVKTVFNGAARINTRYFSRNSQYELREKQSDQPLDRMSDLSELIRTHV